MTVTAADRDVGRFINIDESVRATIRVLVVDDERSLRESCSSYLQNQGYQVEVVGRGEEAVSILESQKFDIVLLDLYMANVQGMDLLRICLSKHPGTIAIIMTGNPSVETSVQALREGAWDYLTKPFSATQLEILIGRATNALLVARENEGADAAPRGGGGSGSDVEVVGQSAALKECVNLAGKVARTDASVFINGESGVGKELIAQYIHNHSRRASRPMVAINCAALPENLLESEMFGHKKGSFTGAVRDKPGLLEQANGGTMFLDELTEMSKPLQAKLLRVIQDGVVRRVGSENIDAVVNVRFIAATNRLPHEAVEEGVLREDLYYRLRVVPIRVPSLRERREDIALLAEHFLGHYWKKHRGKEQLPKLSDAAIGALQAHPWKGNVRELQNVMEHAVVLLESGSKVEPSDIPFIGHPDSTEVEDPISFSSSLSSEKYHTARDRVVAEFETRYLSWLINQADGNMSKAARIAGVDRTTLYRLMEKHGIQRETVMVSSE